MKKYIDYLFWKRTWFRVLFLVIPVAAILLIMLLQSAGLDQQLAKNITCVVYFFLFAFGVSDNENMDCPPNPFKRQTA